MDKNEVVAQNTLTNRINEMVEGESVEVLEEVVKLLNYHMGYHAGVFTGEDSVSKVLSGQSLLMQEKI